MKEGRVTSFCLAELKKIYVASQASGSAVVKMSGVNLTVRWGPWLTCSSR